MTPQEREQKLKALRRLYSGWVPQHEIDKLDGIQPKATEAIAERFAPQPAAEAEVEIKKPRKPKLVE
jgi:hypothetical protein